MAYADPQTVTIATVANTLPRIGQGVSSGSFSKDDGTVQLSIQHNVGRRTKRSIRIVHSKIAPDPLISAQNIKYSMTAQLSVDVPPTGYTVTEQKQIVDALIALLQASSGTATTKLLGGES